jgi:ribonuclease Z
VHEATLENAMEENALEKGHSTPLMAANFALLVRARMLVLTHFSQRYQHTNSEEVSSNRNYIIYHTGTG